MEKRRKFAKKQFAKTNCSQNVFIMVKESQKIIIDKWGNRAILASEQRLKKVKVKRIDFDRKGMSAEWEFRI